MPEAMLQQTGVLQEPVLQTELFETVVARATNRIFDLVRDSLCPMYLGAGGIMLEEFYRNSLELWNERNDGDRAIPAVARSLRKRDPQWNETRLRRSIKLVEQKAVFGSFDAWKALSVSHFFAVQPLEFDSQRVLLDKAQLEGMRVRDLEKEVQRVCGKVAEARRSVPSEPESSTGPTERPLMVGEHPAADAADILRGFQTLLQRRSELVLNLERATIPETIVDHFEAVLAALDEEVLRLNAMLESKFGPLG